MQRGVTKARRSRADSFTLVELLVVIAIIAILASLTLMAGEAVMNQAARSRAKNEIQGLTAALESYKADNGQYPSTAAYSPIFASTNAYSQIDASTLGGQYQVSSQALYEALTGKTNFTDTPAVGAKTYVNFKINQLGNAGTAAATGYGVNTSTYFADPFGNAYGYYTGDAATPQANPPNNGTGFFDLWSTGGTLKNSVTNPNWTNTWIMNWQ